MSNEKSANNITKTPICIYSHSDYSDILKIQFDYFKGIFTEESRYEVFLFFNTAYDDTNYKVIMYDDTLPYMSRVLSCIQKIEGSHFIITHDHDILIRFDEESMDKLIDTAKEYNIDYIDLKHDPLNRGQLPITDTLNLSKMRDDQYYKFSVQPTLWKKESAEIFYSKFASKGYRDSESEDVQEYMKTQTACTLVSENLLISLFHFVSPEYCFMHITHHCELFPLREDNCLEDFIQEEHAIMYSKYLNSSKRNQSSKAYKIHIERVLNEFLRNPSSRTYYTHITRVLNEFLQGLIQ
jgi:hypothetical protein